MTRSHRALATWSLSRVRLLTDLRLLEDTANGPGPLAHGEGERFAMAVGNLIGTAIYPPGL